MFTLTQLGDSVFGTYQFGVSSAQVVGTYVRPQLVLTVGNATQTGYGKSATQIVIDGETFYKQ